MNRVLSADFFARDVATVARDLIGATIIRRSREGLTTGRIVETEAYLSTGDTAAHSAGGVNRKNASMFGPPGRAYVYTIHARQCVNVVTEASGIGSAVLIRAVEPIDGIELMGQRRGTDNRRDLCRGPARLCEAFAIDRKFDGWPLDFGRRLWLSPDGGKPMTVLSSVRIGVTSAEHLPLRYFAAENPFVSGTRKLNATGCSAD